MTKSCFESYNIYVNPLQRKEMIYAFSPFICLEVGLPIQIVTKAASDTLHTLLYAIGEAQQAFGICIVSYRTTNQVCLWQGRRQKYIH